MFGPKNSSFRLQPLLLSSLLLAGCALGPDYLRPTVEAPAAFKELSPRMAAAEAERWKTAATADFSEARWWSLFNDATLDELIARVDVDNQNLKVAEAQYRGAIAALDSARAPLFPSVTGNLSASRGSGSVRGGDEAPAVVSTRALTATAAWEVDVWGRIRRGVEAADARLDASAADLAAARLSIRVLAVQTYCQLRVADAQVAVLERSVAAYLRFLQITRNRYEAGVASALDVAQAETQLGTARTQLLDLQAQRAIYEHALATLVGQPAAQLSIKPNAVGMMALPTIPAVPALVPSTVLERRPDIIAAERRVAAANASIGVAQAAFFPVLNLGANAGYRGSDWAKLISLPNRIWSLGPALALTLFDAGARRAASDQAEAAYDQAVATYRQSVLTAFQEVEDNLVLANHLGQEALTQGQALAAAKRAREIAESQYVAGVVGMLNVISAQTAELSAELNALSISGRRLSAGALLLKNLGGAV